ncbi:hypothetical protein [Phormidesmis sp. 146-33]
MIKTPGLKSTGATVTEAEIRIQHQKIKEGVKVAIAQALERHRRLGESIAVWQDGKVVILEANEIPPMRLK